MSKKTLTQYSEEELLLALQQPEQSNVQAKDNSIPMFLSFYKIEPGNDLIITRFLYSLYKLWANNPVTKTVFYNETGKYLITHQKGAQEFYMINRSSLNLSSEAHKLVIARLGDRTKQLPWKKHFDAFIEHFKIKPGSYFLESFVLYDLYDQYVFKTKKKGHLGIDSFINFCRLYFTQERLTSNKVSWFGVDESIKQFITDEHLATLREQRVKLYGQKSNKKRKR